MVQLLISSVVLYVVARVNYLLFHSIIETFAIIVAVLIYILASRTYKHTQNNMFLFLGISYLHVAVLDFTHMLTYSGMGVFPGFDSNAPTQLWVSGRFMEAASFLIVLFLLRKQFNRRLVTMGFSLVTTGMILSIMVFDIFPDCFVEGTGLTTFKVLSEYVIIFILLGSALLLYLRKDFTGGDVFKYIGTAMVITAMAELSFTLYTDVYGVANMVGHMLKVVSYFVIFSGVVAQGVDEPYSMISRELKDRALKDALTGLTNFQGMMELMEKEINEVMHTNIHFGVLMIDLDNFKVVNDNHGHLFGDRVLKDFARLLENSIRENDVACRFGGDEFVVLVRDVTHDGLDYIKERIQKASEEWIAGDERLTGLGISIGSSISRQKRTIDIDSLISRADKNMYADKQNRNLNVYPANLKEEF